MSVNFDLRLFCENLKATKPPYECPVKGCGKVYRSLNGIQSHLNNHDNSEPGSSTTRSPGSRGSWHRLQSQRSQSPSRGNVDDSKTWVDVDFGGRTYKLNVLEPLVFMDENDSRLKLEKENFDKNLLSPKDTVHRLDVASISGPVSPGSKLPEAQFKILEDYVQPVNVPVKATNYYRFIEKTQEELDEEVEYDMDDEDYIWLEHINGERKPDHLSQVSKEMFETLMDRFEKECYFESQSGRHTSITPKDEDAICSICLEGECFINNVILFCDLCNLAVHQECYGVPHIPDGSWVCRRCLLSPSKSVDCCLCPNKHGAFKQTEDNRWAHVICAFWIPDVGFANSVFLEPIDSIDRIAPARWKLTCYICKQRGIGACIQCHKMNCYTAFHVTCAQQAGLYMKLEPIRDCGPSSAGMQLSTRKTAFCDVHSPCDATVGQNSTSSEDDKDSRSSSLPPTSGTFTKTKIELRKVRKLLSEGRSSSQTLSIPVISQASLEEIAKKVKLDGKERFIKRLHSYWTLKRLSKHGIPLISTSMSRHVKRTKMQLFHTQLSSQSQIQTDQASQEAGSYNNNNMSDDQNPETFRIFFSETMDFQIINAQNTGLRSLVAAESTLQQSMQRMCNMQNLTCSTRPTVLMPAEEFKYCKRLRQQLEKVRLLNELIRKRERLKQEQVKIKESEMELKLYPLVTFLNGLLEKLKEKDTEHIFTEAASSSQIPTLHCDKSMPRNFDQLRHKISLHRYNSVSDFTHDFMDMVNSHLKSCSADSQEYKVCARLRDQVTAIIRAADKTAEKAEYDPETGLHSTTKQEVRPSSTPQSVVRRGRPPKLSLKSTPIVAPIVMASPSPAITATTVAESVSSEASSVTTPENSTANVSSKSSETSSVTKSGTNRRSMILHSHKATRSMRRLSHGLKQDSKDNATNLMSHVKDHKVASKESDDKAHVTDTVLPGKALTSENRNQSVENACENVKSQLEERNAAIDVKQIPFNEGTSTENDCERGAKRKRRDSSAKLSSTSGPETPAAKQLEEKSLVHKGDRKPEDGKIVEEKRKRKSKAPRSASTSSNDSPNEVKDSQVVDESSGKESGSHQYTMRGRQRTLSNEDPGDLIPLEILDLVWAKCKGFPWYPALIISPSMTKATSSHNGVPIPVPSHEVLSLQKKFDTKMFLVCFFDTKRTWQWLPRDKLDPLGVDSGLDKVKLGDTKKPSVRKSVQTAYRKAIEHRCKVTGESVELALATIPVG